MTFRKTKLAKAVAVSLAGGVIGLAGITDASAAATTMYNLTSSGGADFSTNTTVCSPCTGPGINPSAPLVASNEATDGWLYGLGGSSSGTDTSQAKWAGTSGVNKTPFGYTGAHLNWGLHFSAANDAAQISGQDSLTRYGVAADIDTAKGAWSDAATGGASGWRHDLDFGLFKSDTGGKITLNAQGATQSGTNFGFTIFKGMNTNTAYNHHGGWNANNNASGLTASSLPGGGTTLPLSAIVAYSVGGANSSNLNTIIFDALPGQVYTIALGGYRNGAWGDTQDGYKLNVSSAPAAVPVPGAAWLFGSAMAGLVGLKRRKSV